MFLSTLVAEGGVDDDLPNLGGAHRTCLPESPAMIRREAVINRSIDPHLQLIGTNQETRPTDDDAAVADLTLPDIGNGLMAAKTIGGRHGSMHLSTLRTRIERREGEQERPLLLTLLRKRPVVWAPEGIARGCRVQLI
jgi:hypothetical protein